MASSDDGGSGCLVVILILMVLFGVVSFGCSGCGVRLTVNQKEAR